MNLSNYIPTGRTSLVKKGDLALQVQTEYAYRPFPRLTTTILNNGQLLHKIEKKLDKPITSNEERSMMEERMKQQHAEIVRIIKANNDTIPIPPMTPDEDFVPSKAPTPEESMFPVAHNQPEPLNPDEPQPTPVKVNRELADKLKDLPGVKYVYQLDMDGNFVNKVCSEHFKNAFSALFKNIPDIIEIFGIIPGVTINREKGVYEVERDSLYLLSSGTDFYFVLLDDPEKDMNYEQLFKSIISPSVFQARP